MMADEDAIPKTIDKVIDVAESLGGHIAGRKDQSVQIKVPSASFREAMTKIEDIGGVVGRSVTADDVSEEFHDLEVRLGNLRVDAHASPGLPRQGQRHPGHAHRRARARARRAGDRPHRRSPRVPPHARLDVGHLGRADAEAEGRSDRRRRRLRRRPRLGVDLPIPWVGEVGIDPLLSLRK